MAISEGTVMILIYVVIVVALLIAARGILRALRFGRFMVNYSNANAFDEQGFTPLHRAAALGELEYLRMLLANCAIVDQPNSVLGGTPLHFACQGGNLEAVRILVEAGADTTACDPLGRTPVDIAHGMKNAGVVEYLVNHEAPSPSPATALWNALRSGDEEALVNALSAGAAANSRNTDGVTPLHYALANGLELMSARLLMSGADLHAMTPDAFQPIHLAAMSGSGLLEDMIHNGAAVDAQNTEGNAPLHYAAMFGHEEAAMLLLQNGATANIRNQGGATPLHTAAGVGHHSVLDLLLAYADANPIDNDGSTPLHVAAEMGQVATARMLLRAGASPDARDLVHKLRPEDLAARAGHVELAELLGGKGRRT
jgi:ankyrin-2